MPNHSQFLISEISRVGLHLEMSLNLLVPSLSLGSWSLILAICFGSFIALVSQSMVKERKEKQHFSKE